MRILGAAESVRPGGAFGAGIRFRELGPNPIQGIVAECRRLQATGQRVVDLSVGEPDFPPPPQVGAAALRAIGEHRARYTPAAGIPQLRAALGKKLNEEGLPYVSREIMVTPGASGALLAALQALLAPGDEVLFPSPFYPPFVAKTVLAGGVAVPVPTALDEGFKLRPESLAAALTPRSRVLILNNPCNPTGVVYGADELRGIADVALSAGLTLIADEVYGDLVYEGEPFSSVAALGPDVRERTLVVRSFSKSHAMTGWRVGYAAGPEPLVRAMTTIQEASVVALPAVSQWAALEALTGPQEARLEMISRFAERHREVRARLESLPGLRCAPGRGGLFFFPEIGVGDTRGFASRALRNHGVAVVPGDHFGVPGCVRLTFAAGNDEVQEGLRRLAAALDERG